MRSRLSNSLFESGRYLQRGSDLRLLDNINSTRIARKNQSEAAVRWLVEILIKVTNGMRAGELSGLRWMDIDWEQDRLQVVRQLQWIPRQRLHILGLRRSQTGAILSLNGWLLRRFLRIDSEKNRRSNGCGHWQENNVIFPTTTGTPLDPHRLLDVYKEFLYEAGLPVCLLHDLRHSAAMLMFGWSIHPKVVQERLGHAHISHTLGIYSHVLPTIQGEAAEEMDFMLLCTKEKERLDNG